MNQERIYKELISESKKEFLESKSYLENDGGKKKGNSN